MKAPKQTYHSRSLEEKGKIIEDHLKGVSKAKFMENYKIPKSTHNKIQHQESLLNIVAQAVLNGLSEQCAFFQSLDDCDDQDLSALRWLESRALKQVEKSTAQKQPEFQISLALSNCMNVIVTITDCDLHNQ